MKTQDDHGLCRFPAFLEFLDWRTGSFIFFTNSGHPCLLASAIKLKLKSLG